MTAQSNLGSVTSGARPTLRFTVDGRAVEVPDEACSLLEVLRDRLGVRGPKDGCSPQGQCGCCTVLVDGQPRVACVTPARRAAGREVTTVDGLDPDRRARWAEVFLATGASQCGFCTPGIILRLDAEQRAPAPDPARALLAHLCRCTGWRSILDAWAVFAGPGAADVTETPVALAGRDLDAAARRAGIEGGVAQRVGPEVVLGRGGFADDEAPSDALVAVTAADGSWVVGETLAEARALASKVQGRRSTLADHHPIELPDGPWDRVLQTTWVEPAYLETDASWCRPGGTPASPLGNAGAFGGKVASPLPAVARELADRHGRPVRVLWSREDSVRRGPKRPPLAAGLDIAAGRVAIRVARTPGVESRLRQALDGYDVSVTEVDVAGPPTSLAPRAAGWAEGVVLRHGLEAGRAAGGAAPGGGTVEVVGTAGGRARVAIGPDGAIAVTMDCGRPLDRVVARSYAIGAVHMALSWVTSEAIAVDPDGVPVDLTVRSFGVLRAVDTPPIDVAVLDGDGPPVNGSDAVFAATAAAVWAWLGFPPAWPAGVARAPGSGVR
jgi:xanthine dehydrogenase small subunit